jgi:ABC-type antimicrobial peptide transport system, permease component
MIFLRIFQESLQFAWHALTVNKLRTFLSLIGVTIGILTMVSVFTIFDSLESSIRGSVQNLGSNVIYVQKWPWGGSGEYPWWKYYQRPEPSFDELAQLERRMETAEILAYAFGKSQTVNFGRNTVEGVDVISISHRFNDIWQHEFQAGRYFSVLESQRGSPVTVLGAEVAEALFPAGNALGQNIRILGRKLRVIGVLVKEGSSLVGNNVDSALWVPANYTRSLMSLKNREGAFIMANAQPEVE